eukprot:8958543-Alexandrium_andersonii.AAC.1
MSPASSAAWSAGSACPKESAPLPDGAATWDLKRVSSSAAGIHRVMPDTDGELQRVTHVEPGALRNSDGVRGGKQLARHKQVVTTRGDSAVVR